MNRPLSAATIPSPATATHAIATTPASTALPGSTRDRSRSRRSAFGQGPSNAEVHQHDKYLLHDSHQGMYDRRAIHEAEVMVMVEHHEQ